MTEVIQRSSQKSRYFEHVFKNEADAFHYLPLQGDSSVWKSDTEEGGHPCRAAAVIHRHTHLTTI